MTIYYIHKGRAMNGRTEWQIGDAPVGQRTVTEDFMGPLEHALEYFTKFHPDAVFRMDMQP